MNKQHPPFSPIDFNNRLALLNQIFSKNNSNKALKKYCTWIDNQPNPSKSYHDHPIDSEEQLIKFKKDFEKLVDISLGAYLRIKRAYFILNNTEHSSNIYEYSYIKTPIGNMLAIFHENKLCLLEFLERKMLETELKQIIKDQHAHFLFKKTTDNKSAIKLQTQLDEYFIGKRKNFDIMLDTLGTEFQCNVWKTLQTIEYGRTISYQDEAKQMGKPTAMRAVANANGKNKISIVIPCHRVIRKSGELGGYGGGLWRKRYLLTLEGSF